MSAPASLEWAIIYRGRGWSVIELPLRSKNPARDGWQNERLTDAEIRVRFNRPCNVGVLLGEPSGGLTDIDLDCAEARALAASFLPSSMSVFGRPGNPASHVLYVVRAEVATKRYTDPSKLTADDGERAVLVEIRSTGCQTVFPGSIHPTGEEITWVYDKTAADVDASDLQRCVDRLAAASLLARHWPSPGSRQEAALALSGGLLRSGWDATDAEFFVASIAHAAGDEEAFKRTQTAKQTRKRLDQGGKATGWNALGGLMDDRVVAKVREWLGVSQGHADREEAAPRRSQADELVEIGSACELFTDPYGAGMARIAVKEHKEVWSLKSQHFGSWLRYEYWQSNKKAVGNDGLRSAVGTLEGMARFEGQQHALGNRVAGHEDVFYYDLADGDWSTIAFSREGWNHEPHPPIVFRRYAHQAPQVLPISGGDPWKLFAFLNVKEDCRLLLLVWTIAALIPDIPHPIVNFHGEKGAGKSVGQRVMRRLIDPSHAESLSFPLDRRELVQQLAHHYAPIYDNLDSLPGPISDLFCRAVTGEAFTKRELFSDDDDVIYAYRRVLMLNGINVAGQRPDLLDRTILIELQRIEREQRRDETQFWEEYKTALPGILGGMLDCLPAALREVKTIELREMERMADFTRYGAAITRALGRDPEDFLDSYRANIGRQNREALEAHQVGRIVLQLMEARDIWSGSPTELLRALEDVGVAGGLLERNNSGQVISKGWPKAAHILSRRLNEVRSNLRDEGIVLTDDHAGDRKVVLSKRQRGESSVRSVRDSDLDATDAGFAEPEGQYADDFVGTMSTPNVQTDKQQTLWTEEVS